MPKGLRRIHGGGDWHFITCSCYRRQQFLASARRKDLFLRILEEVRVKHNFIVGGYVVMPEHFHLLISEPARGSLSLSMQVLKQRVSRACRKKQRQRMQVNLWATELGHESQGCRWPCSGRRRSVEALLPEGPHGEGDLKDRQVHRCGH